MDTETRAKLDRAWRLLAQTRCSTSDNIAVSTTDTQALGYADGKAQIGASAAAAIKPRRWRM